ncbi:MAG: SpoIIE family protein phosphatase [Oscillospiraceae bacterium]|nr:SpoIIE family protein phosphatase [Oscillospiraceae bacterium]
MKVAPTESIPEKSTVNMRRFYFVVAGITAIFLAEFYLVSIHHNWLSEHVQHGLIAMFIGFTTAVALYHLAIYIYAVHERSYLIFVLSCVFIILRFATEACGILVTALPENFAPILNYISEMSVLLFSIMSIWFAYEMLKLKPGGKILRVINISTISFTLVMTTITGQITARWWFGVLAIPHFIVIMRALRSKQCRKNPYIMFYICAMICTVVLPVTFKFLPHMPLLHVPLLPTQLLKMMVQTVLLAHGYGEVKRHSERLLIEKERDEAELDIARRIQSSMLPNVFPAFPERTEFEIHASMKAARWVGGDFYDMFLVDENTLAIVIADVSGKGVPAALFMAIAKNLIKSNTQEHKTPGKVFETVNNMLAEGNDASMFVTAFLGCLDIPSGRFTFANAGHNLPLLRRSGNNNFEWLHTESNFVLAAMAGITYSEHEIYLQSADELFLYTDGVTEAADNSQELFSDPLLLEKANLHSGLCPEEFITAIKREVDDFADGAEQSDDITMLVLKYN